MHHWKLILAGILAGAVNGLLGTGGGMLLVPLLSGALSEEEIFPSSVAIILPMCAVSLAVSSIRIQLPWNEALPYLIGCIPAGLLAGLLGRKIPTKWLHRILGIIILWGGIRYLWF